jgi:NADH-quinone oxidoreductase subunit D
MMEEYNLPVGPQHPALKEPESFRFKVEGEIVTEIDVRLGYSHRGIEKACESRTYVQCLYLIERICGICSHSHTSAFAQGVETILGLEVPRRAKYIRAIVGELERVHSHMLWLGVAGHQVGFDSLLMYAWRDREVVQDALELISGNRVNYAMNTIGGVRRDVTKEQAEGILRVLGALRERLEFYSDVVRSEATLLARLNNVGRLSKEDALRHCTVGPVARASGVDVDLRRDDPYGAYAEIPFRVITSDRCDLMGRVIVKLQEIAESVNIIEYALTNLPEGPVSVRSPRRVKEGYVVSRYEAPRGEDLHFIVSDGSDHPARVKVRAPTLANIPAIVETMKGSYIADIPIIIAGIDPCFSCTDRAIVIDDGADEHKMTWEELRRYGVRWYRERT